MAERVPVWQGERVMADKTDKSIPAWAQYWPDHDGDLQLTDFDPLKLETIK